MSEDVMEMRDADAPPPVPAAGSDRTTKRRRARVSINTHQSPLKRAISDLWFGLLDTRVWALLAWSDVRNQHRRSKLGPFWITLSMAFLIATLGLLFAELFDRPPQTFVPHVALGLMVWRIISTLIEQGCRSFSSAESLIKQLYAPLSVHAYRLVWRTLLIFAHHFVVFLAIVLIFQLPVTPQWAWAGLGIVLIGLTGVWISLLFGMICARYRDVPNVVSSATYILFFLTPVVWLPEAMSRRAVFLHANPFYHYIELIRGPLLNKPFDPLHWQVAGAITLVGWIVTFLAFARFRPRIAYWL